ncbi:MAG: hypothetical protein ACRDTU_00455 [Micromonosporaceae bacterium]
MRSGACVKCGDEQVYGVDENPNGGGGPRIGFPSGLRKISYFLVCAACGYAERYVTEHYRAKLDRHGAYIPPESERGAS